MKLALKNLGNAALKVCYRHTNLHYHVEIHKTTDLEEGLFNASAFFGGSSRPLCLLLNVQDPSFDYGR